MGSLPCLLERATTVVFRAGFSSLEIYMQVECGKWRGRS
jgi:hypothetical protein